MAIKYIHELKKWPNFTWDQDTLNSKIEHVRLKQGQLVGKMESLGFVLKTEASLQTMTEDVLKTSEIEGEKLDRSQVRSSIARRLGIDAKGLVRSPRDVDGIVEVLVDATQKYNLDITSKRLFEWHAALFPLGQNTADQISVGKWRNDSDGPMRVISGPIGKAKIHFEAPAAKDLKSEMNHFLKWFNSQKSQDSILRAAIAHLWFVTIHPFDDGNGRIARALTDLLLARSEKSPRRFYSMSSQICMDRKNYYKILETTQKGNLDITEWLDWFISCMGRAIKNSEIILSSVLNKENFWQRHATLQLNERQIKIINRLLDGFDGKLTSTKWALMAKCSQDTASRDIANLIESKILKKDTAGGRSTSYLFAV